MTLGRLLKWIFVGILSFIIGVLLAMLGHSNICIGFIVGMIWTKIFEHIMGYKTFSPKRLIIFVDKVREIERERINS